MGKGKKGNEVKNRGGGNGWGKGSGLKEACHQTFSFSFFFPYFHNFVPLLRIIRILILFIISLSFPHSSRSSNDVSSVSFSIYSSSSFSLTF